MPLENNYDDLQLSLRWISEIETIDGIDLFDCFIIECNINGIPVFEDKFFTESLAVPDSLLQSRTTDGELLIFTCACGIADDGGWKLGIVEHTESTIKWTLRRGSEIRNYRFHHDDYSEQIKALSSLVQKATAEGKLIEPTQITYPEN